jgi:hypothetical protein
MFGQNFVFKSEQPSVQIEIERSLLQRWTKKQNTKTLPTAICQQSYWLPAGSLAI